MNVKNEQDGHTDWTDDINIAQGYGFSTKTELICSFSMVSVTATNSWKPLPYGHLIDAF